jgi:hypothetical protein
MKSHPPHLKIQRAKAVVYKDGKRVLTVCELCGSDVYLLEGESTCTECRTKNRRKLMKARKSR